MQIRNATKLPQVYYGLHFAEGIAEYQQPDREPYRILVNEDVCKKMDQTFPGKPVYVKHVAEVELKDIQNADGFVTESFFNKADGKHWCKFIVVSDAGHEAISKGWTLSNAYLVEDFVEVGGKWHGCDYSKEVKNAVYEHLAIVPNPRYTESKILTPEQFKAYNSDKEAELVRLANSKGEEPVINFFKREKVANSAEFASISVTLPKSKKEMTIEQIVNELDLITNMEGYASPKHMVKVDEQNEMSVEELTNAYCGMKKENEDRMAAEAAAKDKMKADKKENDDKKEEDKKENDEKKDEDKKENDEEKDEKKDDKKENDEEKDKKDEDKKENDKDDKKEMKNDFEQISKEEKEFLRNHFENMKGAPAKAKSTVQNEVHLSGLELGKARYGA